MRQPKLEDLLWFLQTYGTEEQAIEVKKARDQLPKSCLETLSAFANSTGGGVLVLGIDEEQGFSVSGVMNPGRLQQDLAAMARTQLTPPLQPRIQLAGTSDSAVVMAEIPELPRAEKPCYVTARGMSRGSYVRVGDGDRRLTAEEITQLVADRGQPRFDREPVEEAAPEDLDSTHVASLLTRVRQRHPRVFDEAEDTEALRVLGVLCRTSDGRLVPTLGGLLTLGTYPQRFFPQLCVTFVHYPSPEQNKIQGESVRFLDNQRVDGPIPGMVSDALAAIRRNMSRRAIISGVGRKDVWEYPPEALREAIVNALAHRDLSPGSRGTQVQIEMYPDRLKIMNPGGLFGAVDINRLGEQGMSSSRNALILRILEDVVEPGENRTVCENRGSGIRTMRSEISSAGMSPPEFQDRVTSFEVSMPNHTLFDQETVDWIAMIGKGGLSDSQCTALALLKHGEVLDNARYRSATSTFDSRQATAELQDLVARELVEQHGQRRHSRYSLSEYARSISRTTPGAPKSGRVKPNRRRQIIDLTALHSELSKAEICTMLNINPKSAEYWLAKLKKEGLIELTHPAGSRDARYRLTATAKQLSLFADSRADEGD